MSTRKKSCLKDKFKCLRKKNYVYEKILVSTAKKLCLRENNCVYGKNDEFRKSKPNLSNYLFSSRILMPCFGRRVTIACNSIF